MVFDFPCLCQFTSVANVWLLGIPDIHQPDPRGHNNILTRANRTIIRIPGRNLKEVSPDLGRSAGLFSKSNRVQATLFEAQDNLLRAIPRLQKGVQIHKAHPGGSKQNTGLQLFILETGCTPKKVPYTEDCFLKELDMVADPCLSLLSGREKDELGFLMGMNTTA